MNPSLSHKRTDYSTVMVASVPVKVCAAASPVPTAVIALAVVGVAAEPAENWSAALEPPLNFVRSRVVIVPALKLSAALVGRVPAFQVSAALLPPENLLTSTAVGVPPSKVSVP